MSHEIEYLNGKYCHVYNGEKPWHGLGVEVSDDLTPQEMLRAAGLDWKVKLRQLYYDAGGQRVKVGNKALVRDVDGKALTVVSKDWNPVQNEEAFAFFDDLVRAGNMKMNTAGSLLGGKKVWALAKVEEAFDLVVDGKKTRDVVEGYLLLTNPHEYGRSIDARFTSVRVVCNNTHCLAMSSRGEGAVSLNHRRKFDPARLQDMMGFAHVGMEGYKEKAEFLAKKRYTEEVAKQFFSEVFPHGNDESREEGELSRAARIGMDVLEQQPGADVAPGTYWNLFNAVTFMSDHVTGRSADNRMTSSWYGHGRARKDRALDLAVNLAKAA